MHTSAQQKSAQTQAVWRQTDGLDVGSCLLAFCFCAVYSTNTFASVNSNIYSLSFAELPDIKVTGSTLVDKSLNEVPAAVTVFGRDQIRRMGAINIVTIRNLNTNA